MFDIIDNNSSSYTNISSLITALINYGPRVPIFSGILYYTDTSDSVSNRTYGFGYVTAVNSTTLRFNCGYAGTYTGTTFGSTHDVVTTLKNYESLTANIQDTVKQIS